MIRFAHFSFCLLCSMVLLFSSCGQGDHAHSHADDDAHACTHDHAGCTHKPQVRTDTLYTLENDNLSLTISAFGGAYVQASVPGSDVNPFSWSLTKEQMPDNNKGGALFQGHFLCLGRWGSPTEGEIQAGVPHNGQASNTWWLVDEKSDRQQLIMSNYAPMDGMFVKRKVELRDDSPVFYVRESVENITSILRLNNVVQHITLGYPFFDTSMQVNSNAGAGFLQSMSYPDPYAYSFQWPKGIKDSLRTPLNLEVSHDPFSYVASHIYMDSIGWLTAVNPDLGLLIGYLWRTADYPWANIWHQYVDEKPWAKGLEFGTTGVGRSYQELLELDTRFHGIPSFEYLDAREKVEKHYVGFFIPVEAGYEGVKDVVIQNNTLQIIPNNNKQTKQVLALDESLFLQ